VAASHSHTTRPFQALQVNKISPVFFFTWLPVRLTKKSFVMSNEIIHNKKLAKHKFMTAPAQPDMSIV
jgi:hypothetical protein